MRTVNKRASEKLARTFNERECDNYDINNRKLFTCDIHEQRVFYRTDVR